MVGIIAQFNAHPVDMEAVLVMVSKNC